MSHDLWYVYGAGGLGAETLDILRSIFESDSSPRLNFAFIDDVACDKIVYNTQVHALEDCAVGKVTIAVGEPSVRKKLLKRITKSNLEMATIISPSAVISGGCSIENGVIIAPLCSVQSRAKIEANVAVNTMAIVGHDVVVRESSVVSSMVNLGGGVEVGEGSYVGMGALIKEGVSVGANSIIGMGAVVYKDVPEGMIALGNPARVVRRNEDQKVFK
ncbi:NeuD/PglB/VioB family sugar acetyltransferase [Pseudopelagicola sp. nBUS_20]|uniref:NeuD/PglB/VioB family sugar acetyltransferase n=1 Tax=Pseudopelagicola sp. nBUS_20 TaxID=3395317 RepID=UPI003EB850BC